MIEVAITIDVVVRIEQDLTAEQIQGLYVNIPYLEVYNDNSIELNQEVLDYSTITVEKL